jgi:glycosyltransferase involved in cell wall biosynthesis
VLAAWAAATPAQPPRPERADRAGAPAEEGGAGAPELVVAGVERALAEAAWRAGGGAGPLPASVRVTGPLAPAAYRALLRRSRVFVTAPRREDYGISQLEALADGCALVTTAAPGPYAALPLARAIAPELVLPAGAGAGELAGALRTALGPARAPTGAQAAAARAALLAPFMRAAADRAVARELLPRLLS